MMDRRTLLALVGGVITPSPLYAQQDGAARRIGLVFTTQPLATMQGPSPSHNGTRLILQTLRDAGFVEGQNLIVERRSAEGRPERYREIIAGLVERKIDVILTAGNELALVAKQITAIVPIVAAGNLIDPVGAGLVDSLARPGGNVTGIAATAGPEFEAKRLQILREAIPTATPLAYLSMRADWEGANGTAVRAAARELGLTLVFAEHSPTNYTDAFALIARERAQALLVARTSVNNANVRLIADLAVKHRLPAMFPYRSSLEAGGLLSYGTNIDELWRAAGRTVVKILQGIRPADIPIEQPTKFELIVNLKAARALGLTIPPSILIRADEVIE